MGLIGRDLVGGEFLDGGITSLERTEEASFEGGLAGRRGREGGEELQADGVGGVADRREANAAVHELSHDLPPGEVRDIEVESHLSENRLIDLVQLVRGEMVRAGEAGHGCIQRLDEDIPRIHRVFSPVGADGVNLLVPVLDELRDHVADAEGVAEADPEDLGAVASLFLLEDFG